MKILFLADDFPPTSFGGAGISTYELARGMHDAGHSVYAITTCRKIEDAGVVEYNGITVHKIASNYPERWRAYVSLYNIPVAHEVERILKDIKPDVVHINNVHFYLSYRCFALAKKYAKATIFTARDTMSVCFGKLGTRAYLEHFEYKTSWVDHLLFAKKRYNPVHNLIARKYLALADRRFAVSEALQKGLLANGIQDVNVMHTGADAENWESSTEEIDAFRKKYNLVDTYVILFAGRLSEGKGGSKTIDAFAEVSRKHPQAVLLVAGSKDAYAEKMIARAATLGVRDKIIITGWIDNDVVRVAYAVSSVVVVPSLYLDPFPRVAIEAMAAGRPVVGTCYGGAPEIVVDSSTGYVVNPSNVAEYAAKIHALLENPAMAEKFGQAGKMRIKKHFNLEDVVKEYIVVYESVIKA